MATRSPKILIATYPRTGSSALQAVLTQVLPFGCRSLHEPFSKYRAGHPVHFWRDVDEIVQTTDVLKHHPGNVLSPRQNRHLYRSWLDAGGRIVHLTRHDRMAQARSLAIARALNSFHRAHRLHEVPADILVAEHADLEREVSEQTALLAEFEPIAASYEDLFEGGPASRMLRLRTLLDSVEHGLGHALDDPDIDRVVGEIMSPERRVRPGSGDAGVRFRRFAPAFMGCAPLFGFRRCREIAGRVDDAIGRGHEVIVDRRPALYGCRTVDGEHLLSPAEVLDVAHEVAAALRATANLRVDRDSPVQLSAIRYDGDAASDHDLQLAYPPLGSTDPSVHFTISLTEPDRYAGGEVHLAGRGSDDRSRGLGELFYFADGIGARRTAVSTGVVHTLVGAIRLERNQILASGQLIQSSPWRDGPPLS